MVTIKFAYLATVGVVLLFVVCTSYLANKYKKAGVTDPKAHKKYALLTNVVVVVVMVLVILGVHYLATLVSLIL